MMKTGFPLFVLFILSLSISCKKDSTEKQPDQNHTVVPDTISYTDLNPDMYVNSIFSTISIGPCGNVGQPNDTTVSDSIRFLPDSTYEFSFSAVNYYSFVSASNQCSNYNNYIAITLLNSYDSIATNLSGCCTAFGSGDTINSLLFFTHNGSLYRHQSQLPPGTQCAVTGDVYLGIKRCKNNKINYGWMRVEISPSNNGVYVKEFAINETNEKAIVAGQKN